MISFTCLSSKMEVEPAISNAQRVHRHKPWVNYSQFVSNSDDEFDVMKSSQHRSSNFSLPKGVIRGCSDCNNCQKVLARWRPQGACMPDLGDAPVFYPNEEEFKDTLNYIASIKKQAASYGICRIVPPPSWKPPSPFKEKSVWEGCEFRTRTQRIDKLQNRTKNRKIYSHVKKKKRTRIEDETFNSVNAELEDFGFEPGPDFTLDSFKNYADYFKAQYFSKNKDFIDSGVNPSVESIEGEYWRVVEKPTEEIEVLYGADIETGGFGSGFPKSSGQISDEKYIKSGWNLNNVPRLSGSVLSYESSDISGILVPWLYIGMCFSSFCWHVEDHHLYSLNYMHWGDPKMWYGVPSRDALKFEATMKKHLPGLFQDHPDLLHKLVTQLSLRILKSKGVSVYRCVQKSGEFVLTFPRAYHSGFNCGFNCAEAVNVAPVDWLSHGQNAVGLYQKERRKTSISHDKLLLGAARDAVRAQWGINLQRENTSDHLRWNGVCGRDGILAKAFMCRIEMERVRRRNLCQFVREMKMYDNFDDAGEKECCICFFDLHFSAASCSCSSERFACLDHAESMCSCPWSNRFFLCRYSLDELDTLVEALEGKLSKVYRWAKSDLGLVLESCKGSSQIHGPVMLGSSPSSMASKKDSEKKDSDAEKSVPKLVMREQKMEKFIDPEDESCVCRDRMVLESQSSSMGSIKHFEERCGTGKYVAEEDKSFVSESTALKSPPSMASENSVAPEEKTLTKGSDMENSWCRNGEIAIGGDDIVSGLCGILSGEDAQTMVGRIMNEDIVNRKG